MTRFVPVIHGVPADRPDEADVIANAGRIAASLERLGYQTETVAVDLDLSGLVRLAARRPFAVFNLVDSLRGDAVLAHLAPCVLDHLGLPYTGVRSRAFMLTLSKLTTKVVLRAHGLPTPDWQAHEDGRDPKRTVIVKSDGEHASLGIDAGSVVPASLAATEIAAREARFGGTFFAEAFIEGREFNVAVLEEADGPHVLPLPEMTFDGLPPERPTIVDYEAKWLADTDAYHLTRRRFGLEGAEPRLAARLKALALACWRLFGLSGYARVDMRVDMAGAPYILEVNANPCLAPDAGFAATAEAAGIPYDDLIGRIVRVARRSASTHFHD